MPRLPLERIKESSAACAEQPAHTSITPLLFSVYKGHWEIAALLLENGADVQGEENEETKDMLWLAADAEQWDLVKHCIQNGIYVKDEVGAMVLSMAVEKRQWEIVKMLVEKDIDVRWCGEALKKPLMLGNEKSLSN
ncbi:MAG: ankyrin repeat domain-containing protein [Bacteroidota bacterium]